MGISISIGTMYAIPVLEGEVIVVPPDNDDIIIEPNIINLILPVPADVVSGDVLVALISTDANPTITAPSGWTLEDSIGGTAKSFVYYRYSPGGEPVDYTWVLGGAEDAVGSIIRVVSVDPEDIIHAKVTSSGTGSTVVVPAITTLVNNAMLVTLISLNDGVLVDPPRGRVLWLVNSSGTAIGSVGSSASYVVVRSAGVVSSYNLDTNPLVSTDYYIIMIALAPIPIVFDILLDSNGDKLQDSDGNQLTVPR